jgi:hypothetical protein
VRGEAVARARSRIAESRSAGKFERFETARSHGKRRNGIQDLTSGSCAGAGSRRGAAAAPPAAAQGQTAPAAPAQSRSRVKRGRTRYGRRQLKYLPRSACALAGHLARPARTFLRRRQDWTAVTLPEE